VLPYRVLGTYLESCNCDAICPCRRANGVPGGRSTHGICEGALSWSIHEGECGGTDLAGLGVVLALRYSDDEEGSPWTFALFVDDRGDAEQRAALGQIFTGELGGSAVDHFPWAWKRSRPLGASAARIEIDHTPGRGWFRAGASVAVRVSGPYPGPEAVTCVIPGHERSGRELVVEELQVAADGLAFEYAGVCAYESTFDYAAA
jgi:hypothetical protein